MIVDGEKQGLAIPHPSPPFTDRRTPTPSAEPLERPSDDPKQRHDKRVGSVVLEILVVHGGGLRIRAGNFKLTHYQNYSSDIALELSGMIAANYQLAFNKGFEIGQRSKEPK